MTPQDPAEAARPMILVVDDQSSNILIMFEMLKDDYEICAASNGLDALAFCARRIPDLILLDIGMPVMDGLEVCRRLKSEVATRDIPIIFVSGHNGPLEEAQALDHGGADFMGKPVHAKVLRARILNRIMLKLEADGLRSLATTDGLTGIANRRRFDEALREEWRRAARDEAPLSLLLLDIDHFKSFNDQYGHQAGDSCLQAVAAALVPFARRPGDLVARYGGEEMAILLPRAEAGFAGRVAETARAAIAALRIAHSGNAACGGVVTASFGVATGRPQQMPTGWNLLVRSADEMLYGAKSLGRNQVMRQPAPAD